MAISKIRRTALATALVTSLTAMALTACSGDESNGDAGAKPGGGASSYDTTSLDASDVCTEDKQGGMLRYRASPEGAGLDPVVSQSNINATAAVYGTLMGWDSQAQEFVGDVAESMTPNDDSTSWTMKLRDDVTYSDGTPLDAEAVKANVERYLDPDFPSAYTSRVAEIASTTVKDASTVVFELSAPWGTFPWLFTQNVGMIVNPTVLDEVDQTKLAALPPENAGVGAFTVGEYRRGQDVTLVGKKDWWGGPVCLDELVISFGANDGNADFEALQAGQVDGTQGYDPQVVKRAKDDGGYQLVEMPGAIGSPMLLNSAKAPFDDVRMRQALNLAMDRDLINQRIFQGLALPSGGVVPPDTGYDLAVEPAAFDEGAASALAEESGASTSFGYTVNRTPINENLAILQQALAKNAGLDMDLDMLAQPEWIEKIFGTRNFDSAMGGVVVDPSCPYCGLDQFTTTSATNVGSFSSPAVDEALAALKAARPGPDMATAIDKVQEAFTAEVPVVFAAWIKQLAILSPAVHGVRFSTSTFAIQFDRAYIEQ
jgi:peptide/nickel transport system substrate-binding protein